MKSVEKIQELKSIIHTELRPHIDNDYVLWGLPYHSNIGDILIWQGELEFLKDSGYKCKGTLPYNDLPCNKNRPNLSKNTIILIHGGGYLGDTWRNTWSDVLKALTFYPNNKIIFLPQSIYYKDKNLAAEDSKIISQFKNVILCARDQTSYELGIQYFGNAAQIIKVPDMAFCIDLSRLEKWRKQPQNKDLYLKRRDKEAIGSSPIELQDNIEVSDWPTMEPGFSNIRMKIHYLFFRLRHGMTQKFPYISRLTNPLADYELMHFFRPDIIRIGVEFISSYRKIYTTRLHVLILSVLLNKEVVSEDNSYGKLSSFYNTWLSDCENVHLNSPQE